MLKKNDPDCEWLEFELFASKRLFQRTYLKKGGLDFSTDDYQRKINHFPQIRIVRGNLSHTDIVVELKEPFAALTTPFDAMMTNKPHVGMLITHADCQAAVLYDPYNKALAVVHCGWRGNVQKIYLKTIQKMHEAYGTEPEHLLVGIAPSLGPHHAEFINYRLEFPEGFTKHQVKSNYFDLWSIAEEELLSCGVLPHHLEMARICTYEDSANYYSYRRDKTRGRHGTVAYLLP